jgi:Holliday junction DNA helicase RuvA
MIAQLEGVLVEKAPDAIVVDVHGVGYELRVPLSTFFALPDEGKVVRLRVHTHVREDAFWLFGFATDLERTLFRLLLGASGVGPKLALAILSGLPVERLVAALRSGDLAALVGIPGVGKKTAERMVLELAEKVASLPGEAPSKAPAAAAADDVISALVNLGYRKTEAERAVDATAKAGGSREFGPFLKEALRRLTSA